LLLFLAGLAIMLIVVSGLMAGLFYWFERDAAEADPAPPALATDDQQTPGPLLQVSPRQDLELMRKREETWLTTPSWIDKERGIARIPIDRAIAVTAEGGLPNWPAVEQGAAPAANQDHDVERRDARAPAGTGVETPVEEGNKP
jgi:hypothetical protein